MNNIDLNKETENKYEMDPEQHYIYKFISIGQLFIDFRLFGTTGYCAACNKVIPAFEMVMRARTNVYHLECFACQQCNHR